MRFLAGTDDDDGWIGLLLLLLLMLAPLTGVEYAGLFIIFVHDLNVSING